MNYLCCLRVQNMAKVFFSCRTGHQTEFYTLEILFYLRPEIPGDNELKTIQPLSEQPSYSQLPLTATTTDLLLQC